MATPTRRATMFRGSELPRLFLLLAIVVVGWPLACRQIAGRRHLEPAPPPRPAAEVPKLPPPDRSAVFRAVQDKTELSYREHLAYAELLRRARTTPAADLGARAMRDVPYVELIDRPARYRGLPIHLEGTARRVRVLDEIPSSIAPSRRIYEASVFTPASQNYPYILAFEEAPVGLTAGESIQEKVAFDGYFFKLMLYRDGDHVLRFAPLLVGRLAHRPPSADQDRDPLGLPRSPREVRWPFVLLGALALYAAVRLVFVLRRSFAPVPRPSPKLRPAEEIDHEALASWLNDGPDDGGPAPGLANGKKPHPPDDDWGA
ncbi:MAG TPA: hypothetical protein VG406_26575 [Isosphaeraceae bacterium]|jgi:hypothetical protein|nr:hypothetical protein [Isosphaeraceae bacterium]